MMKGRSNENKLSFSSNPLSIYQDLAEWFCREMKKQEALRPGTDNIDRSSFLCSKIRSELNEVSKIISTLPIMTKPEDKPKPKYTHKRKRKNPKHEINKQFKCLVCAREGKEQYFETGQGLGGHMSRVHKGESEKFNRKKEIRSRREELRNILTEAKKKMLSEQKLDYDFMMTSKEGKMQIKQFIKDNRERYRKIVRELRKSNFVSSSSRND